MNFYIWIAVAVVSYGIYCYLLGRGKIEFHDDSDSQPITFIMFFACAAWPFAITALAMVGPFILLHKLGSKHRKIDKEKKLMWEKLKA